MKTAYFLQAIVLWIILRIGSVFGINPCYGESTSASFYYVPDILGNATLTGALVTLLDKCSFGQNSWFTSSDVCFNHCVLRRKCFAVIHMGNDCKMCIATGDSVPSYAQFYDEMYVRRIALQGNIIPSPKCQIMSLILIDKNVQPASCIHPFANAHILKQVYEMIMLTVTKITNIMIYRICFIFNLKISRCFDTASQEVFN